jgi:peptidyl-prolyl cis-trans isomerase SurA
MRRTDRKSRLDPALTCKALSCAGAAIAAALVFHAPAAHSQTGGQSGGQNDLRIIAVVNDELISARDQENRLNMIIRTSRLPDTPDTRNRVRDQVLTMLIDERIKLQEYHRRGMTVDPGEIENAKRRLEQQNKIPPGAFDEFLKSQGIDIGTFSEQIRADIAWGKIARARGAAMVSVTEDEVTEVVNRIKATAGQTENLVAEIVIAFDGPAQEAESKVASERLYEQIAGGANFSAVARQFSHGVTAASGGDVGWVQAGGLPAEIETALSAMEPGQVSPPIRGANGYYIVALRERRKIATGDPDETRFTLSQLVVPLAQDANAEEVEKQTALANRLAGEIKGCASVETLAQSNKITEAGPLGAVKLGEVPPALKSALAEATAGHVTAPQRLDIGIQILVVCGRSDPTSGIDPEQIRQSLFATKMAALARRYLRDLRRDTLIEIR